MNVLQIAPIAEKISPNLEYAGTERVIWNLDNKLIEKGIDSKIAASANSSVTGELIPTLDVNVWNYTRNESEMDEKYKEHTEKITKYLSKQDSNMIVHDHDAGFILNSGKDIQKIKQPFLSTLHFSEISEEQKKKWDNLEGKIKDKAILVSISNSQKQRIEETLRIPVKKVIYHGMDLDKFPYSDERQDYLLSVGRISSCKGQDLAIKVAKETKHSLIIAGPVQRFNPESVKFYETEIDPNLDFNFNNRRKEKIGLEEITNLAQKEKGKIFYVGSVNDQERNYLNQYAKSFLMPQRWREGFGLVMTEAMACGNPVIAFNRGSIPEIVRDGKNGYIVENYEEMADRVGRIKSINPGDCRKDIKERFSLDKQVKKYIDFYNSITRN